MCTVDPLPGGWLVRAADEPSADPAPDRVVLDLTRPRRPLMTVSGAAGSWVQELSPRHAELLYAPALHRDGRSAAQPAVHLFDDPTRTVTVRAEKSRLRRHLAQILAHRPYRFVEELEVELVEPDAAPFGATVPS